MWDVAAVAAVEAVGLWALEGMTNALLGLYYLNGCFHSVVRMSRRRSSGCRIYQLEGAGSRWGRLVGTIGGSDSIQLVVGNRQSC
jgi:hypothetical protein